MSQPNTLLHSFAMLQFCCGVLCGIGWYFGMRVERLLPALLAAGTLSLAATLGPKVTAIASAGGSPWGFLQVELSRGPSRILCFLAMTGVLALFAIVHDVWPHLTAAPVEEERLSVRFRRWCRGESGALREESETSSPAPVQENTTGQEG